MGPLRFELKSIAPEAVFNKEKLIVNPDRLDEFIGFREVENLNDKWIYHIRQFIIDYLEYVNWYIDKKKTIDYLNKVRKNYSTTYYRKITYQIRKFLTFLNMYWAKDIKPPSEPIYLPKRVTLEDIKDTLSYFKDNQYYIQIKALVLLGITSGMRAEELYQLTINDINLDSRVVHINHNPQNGQSTKTKQSRISFFNREAQIALNEYLTLRVM